PYVPTTFLFSSSARATPRTHTLSLHDALPILTRRIRLFTAGAPPSPTLITHLADLNFEVDHVYGLTEVRSARWVINVGEGGAPADRKSTRLNSSHVAISYAVFCLKKKKKLPNR